jgi:hypothetical protein
MKLKKEVNEKIRTELSSFHREFRRHLSTFITGAFAFVAALLWRDAISSFLERYKEFIQNTLPFEGWILQFFIAFAVSIVAVVAIVIISKILKVE